MQKQKELSGIVKDIMSYKENHYHIEFTLIDSDLKYGHTYTDLSLANYLKWSTLKIDDHVTGLYWHDASKKIIDGDSPVRKVTLGPLTSNLCDEKS